MFLGNVTSTLHPALSDGILEPNEVADITIDVMTKEQEFLILPHKKVKVYMERRARNHKKWMSGMNKLHRKLAGISNNADKEDPSYSNGLSKISKL